MANKGKRFSDIIEGKNMFSCSDLQQTVCPLPREQSRDAPARHTNHHRSRLGAHVAGLERLTDRVVALEGYRQDRQDARVRHGELDKRHQFTCGMSR